MSTKYNYGQTVWIVESGNRVTECIIVNYSGGLYTIRFSETGGAIKLRESRLFSSREEAQSSVHKEVRSREWH
ncbi:hypothetical protein [Ruminococcus sp.]